MEVLNANTLLFAIGVICVYYTTLFLRKTYYYRTLLHNLPGPPHSYIWGHLKAINDVSQTQPKRVAAQTIMLPIKDHYNLGEYYYLDVWPFGEPMIIMFNTDMLNDITVKTSLLKHEEVENFVKHVGGPGNLVTAEGAEWRQWRSAFNPGFSVSHLMTLVPLIIDQCNIFCDIMTKKAQSGEVFRMEQATTRLTVDIIGKVVLEHDFKSQFGHNEFVDSLIDQLHWIYGDTAFNIVSRFNLRRHAMLAYNTWKMNRYVSRVLDERFATRKSRGKSKAIVDLALEAYLKEVKGSGTNMDDLQSLDSVFKKAAISNMKVFIFAGHDTTSALICYAWFYLSRDPERMAKARKELDDVFGTDRSAVAEQIRNNHYILNKLEYILAIMKEVLRLQPPASTIRHITKGFVLRDPNTGEALVCDEKFMLYPVDVGFHRYKKHWGDPENFRPERFLSSSGGGDYNKDAYIPFGKGIRTCIGQELAIIEGKIILAMTLRSFDFKEAYGELDKLRNDGSGYPSDMTGIQEQYGVPCYQIQLGTAKPREGMPCRLSLRS